MTFFNVSPTFGRFSKVLFPLQSCTCACHRACVVTLLVYISVVQIVTDQLLRQNFSCEVLFDEDLRDAPFAEFAFQRCLEGVWAPVPACSEPSCSSLVL